jgi:hypothetical protein
MKHTKEYARDAAADWPCGCKLALRKLCDCDNPAELDYVQCPMHAAAPALLEALEKAHKDAGNGIDLADTRNFMGAIGALRIIDAESAAAIEAAK